MADRVIIRLVGDQQRDFALRTVHNAPLGYVVTVSEETRTLEQNAKLWPMLKDVHSQVVWHGRALSQDNWKDVFTATLKGQDVVPNLENTGFIAVGGRTGTMSKRMFCDLIELIYAFGAKQDVQWSEKSRQEFADFGLTQ